MADIFYTPRYEADLVHIYKYSTEKWGRDVANRTMAQITDLEEKTLSDPDFGKLDAHFHSPIYRYATIANSQTIFFHRIGDDVIMITAGWAGRAWHYIMQKIEPQIQDFLKELDSSVNPVGKT